MQEDKTSRKTLLDEVRSLREGLAARDRPIYDAIDGLFGGTLRDLRLILYRVNHQTGTLEYISPSVEFVLGVTADAPALRTEENYLLQFHPEDLGAVCRVREEHRQRTRKEPNTLGNFEARWRKALGEYIWVRCRFLFVLDAEGNTVLESGTIEDITDRKRTEAQLRKARHEREVILDSVSELVVFHDLDLNVVWMNRAAAESLGISSEEAVGRKCYTLWQGRDVPCSGCPVVQALRTKLPGEFEVQTPDGRIWEVRGYPSFDDDGTLIGVTEVAKNITERRQAEALLQKTHGELERRVQERTADLQATNEKLQREVEDRQKAESALQSRDSQFRALAKTVPATVFIVQGEYFKYINPVMEKLSGFTREELYQGTFWEHVDPEYRELVKQRGLARLRGENVPPRYEFKFMHKNGDSRWVDASLSMIEYEGAPASLVVAMDITDRKLDEERLRDAHLQLLSAREEERRHLAGELHDSLAQDLVVLQLVLQCGTAALKGKDVPQDWLTEATAMCTRMIGDIRRMSHGLYPPMLETLGLHKAFRSLAEQYEVAGRQVKISWDCGSEDRRFPRPVEITLFRIAQEALSNAVRHGLADKAEVKVTCTGFSVVLEVIDNGRGFDPEDITKMGLGLRSMQDRLRLVHGTFDVISNPGRTCVRAEIPRGKNGECEAGKDGEGYAKQEDLL